MRLSNILLGAVAICAFAAPAMAQNATANPPANAQRNGQFDRIDANHDGAITREEARAAHSAMFVQIDANHDGFVAPEEMHAHHQAGRTTRGQAVRERHIGRLDANNDGNISRQEWTSAPQIQRERMQQMHAQRFDQLDTNHDGQLSVAELDAGRQNRPMAGGGGHRHNGPQTGGPQMGGQPRGPHGAGNHGPAGARVNPDTNNDGKISRAEWDTMPMPFFQNGDLNNDGRVTREEAAQAVRNRPQGQHGRRMFQNGANPPPPPGQ